jgi:hypothetical protein
MALRSNGDGSRPTVRQALDCGEIHWTRADCLAAADGVLDGPEWQPVAIEVRLLTKLTAPPPTPEAARAETTTSSEEG